MCGAERIVMPNAFKRGTRLFTSQWEFHYQTLGWRNIWYPGLQHIAVGIWIRLFESPALPILRLNSYSSLKFKLRSYIFCVARNESFRKCVQLALHFLWSARNNPIIPQMTCLIYVYSGVLVVLYFTLCDFHEKGCTYFPQIRSQIQNSRRHKGDVR